jgi:hypothetical protein
MRCEGGEAFSPHNIQEELRKHFFEDFLKSFLGVATDPLDLFKRGTSKTI